MAPTPVIVQEMAAFIRQFHEHGGSVRTPPHHMAERHAWMVLAKRYRDGWEHLPASKRTEDLKSGLAFMWYSVRQPRCIVALLNLDPVAALSYQVGPDRIEVEVVGSRRLEAAGGAGTSIEFALAMEAERRRMGVWSSYTWQALPFHRRLGRRLDERGDRSSDWTLEDCQFLVRGINDLL
jgi:hypothetical protein